MKSDRFINAVALVALVVTTLLGWSWLWGLLFIYWAVPALHSGEAFLMSPIQRAKAPVLFWSVTGLWVLLGVLMVLEDFAPQVLEALHLS